MLKQVRKCGVHRSRRCCKCSFRIFRIWHSSFLDRRARAADKHEHIQAHPFVAREDNACDLGTTRSFWRNRHSMLFERLQHLLKATGDPEVTAALREANRCARLIRSEVVRQNPWKLQALVAELNVHDIRLMQAIHEDVPGGEALMLALEQCEEVLMIPDTASVKNPGKHVRRPENEVDLSSLIPFVNLGELSSAADEVSETSPLIPLYIPLSADLGRRF